MSSVFFFSLLTCCFVDVPETIVCGHRTTCYGVAAQAARGEVPSVRLSWWAPHNIFCYFSGWLKEWKDIFDNFAIVFLHIFLTMYISILFIHSIFNKKKIFISLLPFVRNVKLDFQSLAAADYLLWLDCTELAFLAWAFDFVDAVFSLSTSFSFANKRLCGVFTRPGFLAWISMTSDRALELSHIRNSFFYIQSCLLCLFFFFCFSTATQKKNRTQRERDSI